MEILKYILSIIVFFIGCSNSIDKISIIGNGVVDRESRAIEKFHSIDVRGAFNVVVKNSNNYKVQIETDQNIIEYINTDIIDEVLFIKYTEKGTYLESKQTTIFINMPTLKYVSSSGANTFHIENIKNEDLLEINGVGEGKISINGSAKDVKMDIAGSLSIFAKNLITKNTIINASGACFVETQALELLDINIAGACNVYYVGTPIVLNERTSGMCSILQYF